MTLNLPAPGHWCGEMNLQVRPRPGNWSEVKTPKSEGQRWNSTICKSPIIDTLRKSSRTCGKGCVSQKRHQYSTWRPKYWSGDYSCRQRWKPPFILDQITLKIWKYTGTQTSRELQNLFDITQKIGIGPSMWDSECDNDWLDRSFMGEIYTFSRSGDYVNESKSTRLLRFRLLMLGENVRSFRSESKMRKSSWRVSTVQFLAENYLELMENRLSSSGIFPWTCVIGDPPEDPERRLARSKQWTWKNVKIESSPCQCVLASNGQREEIQ